MTPGAPSHLQPPTQVCFPTPYSTILLPHHPACILAHALCHLTPSLGSLPAHTHILNTTTHYPPHWTPLQFVTHTQDDSACSWPSTLPNPAWTSLPLWHCTLGTPGHIAMLPHMPFTMFWMPRFYPPMDCTGTPHLPTVHCGYRRFCLPLCTPHCGSGCLAHPTLPCPLSVHWRHAHIAYLFHLPHIPTCHADSRATHAAFIAACPT